MAFGWWSGGSEPDQEGGERFIAARDCGQRRACARGGFAEGGEVEALDVRGRMRGRFVPGERLAAAGGAAGMAGRALRGEAMVAVGEQVRAAARRAGLAFMVTPFSLENFETLRALDVDAVKIASPDAVNHPLLRLTASLGRPMIISTGTADLSELTFFHI